MMVRPPGFEPGLKAWEAYGGCPAIRLRPNQARLRPQLNQEKLLELEIDYGGKLSDEGCYCF